jgi:hypothetical protein
MYKEKCSRLEARHDEQNNSIVDLKQMISRVVKTEDSYLQQTLKENVF